MSGTIHFQNPNSTFEPEHYRIRWLVAILATILCLTFFPYLFGGKTFLPFDMLDTMTAPSNARYSPPQAQNHYLYDGVSQYYPYRVQTQGALRRGALAYWNPHILCGYPQYAETMATNFDIFNVLSLWFEPLFFFHFQMVLEFFIAGIGMLLLLRFMGVSRSVNLIFSTAYMLNSLFVACIVHRWAVASFCWMPFIALMIIKYYSDHKKEKLLYASIFLALSYFGGNLQSSFFVFFVMTAILLFYPSSNSKSNFLSRIGILVFIGTSSFLLSAMMWLPTLELFIQTIFHGGGLNSSNIYTSYSIVQRILSLPLLAYFFFPGLAGSAQIYSIKNIAGADMINFNGAISFLPALFAFWGCFALRKNRTLRPFIIIALSGLLLPILTPLYPILYHRFFIVASFSLCIIGAFALQSFTRSESVRSSFGKMLKWTSILYCGVILILVTLCGYITLNYQTLGVTFGKIIASKLQDSAFGSGNESWMLGRVDKTLQYYSFLTPALWIPLLAGGVIIIVLKRYRIGKLPESRMLIIVFFATVIQLFIFARMWFPSIDIATFPAYPRNPITEFLQRDSSESRHWSWRDASQDPFILPANISDVNGTRDFSGYESLTNPCMSVFYNRHIPHDSLDLRLLGLTNVKYVLTSSRIIQSPNALKIFSADGVTVYQNLLCKPRAYFAYKSMIAVSDTVPELLRPDFDGSTALFAKDDAPTSLETFTTGKNNVHIDRSENEEVVITVKTDSKGILILTDTYYPGWKCSVNGIDAHIYRVNNSMRGVIIQSGVSKVVFRFEPDIFTAGLSISAGATFLFIVGLLFLTLRKKRSTDLTVS